MSTGSERASPGRFSDGLAAALPDTHCRPSSLPVPFQGLAALRSVGRGTAGGTSKAETVPERSEGAVGLWGAGAVQAGRDAGHMLQGQQDAVREGQDARWAPVREGPRNTEERPRKVPSGDVAGRAGVDMHPGRP